MAFSAVLPPLDSFNVNKLLRKNSVRVFVISAKVALSAFIFVCLVSLIASLLDSSLSSGTALAAIDKSLTALKVPTNFDPKANSAVVDYATIEKRNIFGPFTEKTAVTTSAANKPISQVPLDLIGTFLTPGQPPFAIIEDRNKKNQEVFNIGDSIFGAAKLVQVFGDRVEIDRNGQIEVLSLDVLQKRSVDTKDGVASISETEFVVDEAELDKALSNLPMLLTQARAVPYFKDGQSVGLRLFAIKNESLFEKIGLKNGDILKSINGNSMGDLSQAMKLFERLKEERSISVTLERNREDKEFRYQIR